MPEPPASVWLIAFGAGLMLASLATWVYLAYRRRQQHAILAYEPRRPVPWGPIGALLAILLALNSVVSAILSPATAPTIVPNSPLPTTSAPQPIPEQPDVTTRMASMIVLYPMIVGSVVFIIAIYSKATLHDLGLPIYVGEFARDVGIGVVACLAALLPVYGVLSAIELVFREPAHHPIVDAVLREANPVVLLLAAVSAVIVAPICEEITFRLLLQGWLEKRMTNEEQMAIWLPISVSSVLFALAHAGQGSAPVALFFLAMILGYLYQRTHRIIPCIAMHAMFNLLTIVGLMLRMMGPVE
ncbi:MAG: CPBP family intramembrane glutamic endopeptidase [Pirellulales bacterium]